jgi:hypothetical protein
MELLMDGGIVPPGQLGELSKEAQELTAIFVASVRTAKSHRKGDPYPRKPPPRG